MDYQPENLITYIKNVDANNKYQVLSISKQNQGKVFRVTKYTFHDCDILDVDVARNLPCSLDS